MPVRYQNARTHSTVHSVRLSRDLGRTIIIRGFFYSLWNPANLESVHLEVIFSFLSNRVYFRVSSGRHLERRRARAPGVIIRDANRSNVILSSSASSHCRANVGLQTIFVIYFFFSCFQNGCVHQSPSELFRIGQTVRAALASKIVGNIQR